MNEGKILFAQIMEYLPRKAFDNAIVRYKGDYKVKDFTCRDQFLAMAFAQLTLRSSLRGIESTMTSGICKWPRDVIILRFLTHCEEYLLDLHGSPAVQE